jgi:AcrR family transcriptional regulator
MMRIIKEHDERRNEILDTAEKLFHTKGYEKCTVNDILKEVAIAKGTFYYYFKSKQEVLDAIVARYTEIVVNRVGEIIDRGDLSPQEKLLSAFMSMNINNQVGSEILEEMHKTENALLHQRALSQMISTLAPALATIVEEGVEKKVWNCRYPLQGMQIFLAASLTLTDEGIFEQDAASQKKIMEALIGMLEKMLEVPEDSFMKLFIQSREGR